MKAITYRKVSLRYVGDADFRKSAATQVAELEQKRPALRNLGPDEVIMLRRRSGDRVRFVSGWRELSNGQRARLVRDHVLGKGQWDPTAIVEYAKAEGLQLVGLKDWRDRFEKLIASAVAELRSS